ncbi:PilN domain-containing protein [Rhodoferax sp.]|uniref:PilN domain-containing protein n=1 Tax=Rhodoferax sp. TaxID=50421 RepID=UPI00271E8F2B|nr:PilN domain-containing protein [Rhodoferax sp.]MDO9144952.1 PilN domain-containing protein [Rhodoferax sp.]MDP1530762.1 PilN domain-containing protein [Rhodoferax sp.]MDP1942414.1 PilN domain-containing protein [Rhodoferax sp.]MDP2441952.1 PilN domain-containing protein [Rhodoferax sp.]MDP3192726.1 PilN domain-containing protein [Rhodoferax sp.]
MILINLLPHREIARKRRKELFNVSLGLSVFMGGLIAGLIFLWFQSQISSQQEQNQLLQSEISKFDLQIKEIAGLEGEIAALLARQKAVEDLQADRNMPVYLLTELVQQLPDGVYVSSLRQEGQNVALQGVAQSNERVSELLRNLANNSPWFSRPELVEIVAGSVNLTPRDVRRVSNFQIRVKLVRATEAQKNPSQAASVAAAASR